MVFALEADGAGCDHGGVDEGGGEFGEVCGGEFVERVRAEGGGEVYGFAQGVGGDVPAEDAGGFGVGYGVSGGWEGGVSLLAGKGWGSLSIFCLFCLMESGLDRRTYLRSP